MNKLAFVSPAVPANEVKNVLNRHILADGYDIILDVKKSKGCWLVDQCTGKEYLDMFTMYGSMAIGYNHPHILAHMDILGKLALNKPSISDMYLPEYAEFIDTFSRVGIPDYMPHAFFIDGGALAVENALKTAFDWKVRKNIAKGKGEKGSKIIHFQHAFHGRSGYTLSLTNTADPRKYQYFPLFDWPRIPSPKRNFPETPEGLQQTIKDEQIAIAAIEKALAENPDDVAAIIIEPIQAEGGDRHFRKEFLQALKDICVQNDMLLIFDEVQTGVCLTGKFWAHQQIDVIPDVLAFGKKTQVCGILAGERINEIDRNVFKESSRINSTFGGNIVDMYRFKLILEVIERNQLADNAAEKGQYLLNKLNAFQEKHGDKVSQARGLGLMCAFDLPDKKNRDQFLEDTEANGLLLLGCGVSSIRFRPHLIVNQEEIDYAFDLMEKSI